MSKDKDVEVSILIDFYGAILKDKQLEIIDCYYNRDLSLSEIATNVGITRQGVLDSIKRTEAMLYGMEDKLGNIKRFKLLESKVNKISELAHCIKKENIVLKNSNIDEYSDAIVKISKSLCD